MLLACFVQPGLGSPTQLIFLHPNRFLPAAVLFKWLLLLFEAFVIICKAVCLCYWQKFSIKIPIFPPTSTLLINCAKFLSLHAVRHCVGCLCVSFLTFPATATPKPTYRRNKELFWLGHNSTPYLLLQPCLLHRTVHQAMLWNNIITHPCWPQWTKVSITVIDLGLPVKPLAFRGS